MLIYAFALILTGPGPDAPQPPPVAEPRVPVSATSLAAPLYGAQDEEPDEDWHGSLNLGATITSGNSSIITASASADGQKKWDDNRLTLGGNWGFSEQEDSNTGSSDVTQRFWTAGGKYDKFFDEMNYGYAGLKLANDDIADLHLRQTYSVGLGRIFKAEEDLEFEGEAGLAYVDENYLGANDDDTFFALRAGTFLDWQINENTQFLQRSDMYPSLDFSEFNAVLDSTLRVKMSEDMHAQIQWIAKYNNNAPPGAGSTDGIWIFSLGWVY